MSANVSMKSKTGSFIDLPATDGALTPEPREISLEIPEALGMGSLREIRLHSGIRLGILDYEPREPVMEFEGNAPVFGFGFCLSGVTKSRVSCLKESFVIRSGQSGFFHFPDLSGYSEEVKGHILRVLIQMEPDEFFSLMEGDFDRIPAMLRKFADGAGVKPCRVADMITPSMQTALHQILNCPYHGLTRQLFLEGKATELMAYKLEQLESDPDKTKTHPVLKPDDVERIHHAREIISRDLENAPMLLELARLVGLTHTKLNRGFREIYGTTVFGYLRKIRLEQARLLLEEQRMSVTEAAFSVGYNSLPSFSTAFSKHFGLKPIMCIKNSPHTCLPQKTAR